MSWAAEEKGGKRIQGYIQASSLSANQWDREYRKRKDEFGGGGKIHSVLDTDEFEFTVEYESANDFSVVRNSLKLWEKVYSWR